MCLLLVHDSVENKTHFYVNEIASLNQAIQKRTTKIRLSLEKIGTDFMVAVNETKMLIVLLSLSEVLYRFRTTL